MGCFTCLGSEVHVGTYVLVGPTRLNAESNYYGSHGEEFELALASISSNVDATHVLRVRLVHEFKLCDLNYF